jgi:PhnB protein
MTQSHPIPEGFHSVTPHLVLNDAAGAIEFYKQAFGAEELSRMPGPDGKRLMHASIKIGNSILMLCDEFPEFGGESGKGPLALGGSPVTLHLYFEDVDTAFDRAVTAGAKVSMPLSDMFWGDRYGQVVDPFGHRWSLATQLRVVSGEELRAAAQVGCGQ